MEVEGGEEIRAIAPFEEVFRIGETVLSARCIRSNLHAVRTRLCVDSFCESEGIMPVHVDNQHIDGNVV